MQLRRKPTIRSSAQNTLINIQRSARYKRKPSNDLSSRDTVAFISFFVPRRTRNEPTSNVSRVRPGEAMSHVALVYSGARASVRIQMVEDAITIVKPRPV